MLKRLPFALLAISFSVPVVACLNAANDEKVAGDANMLSDAEKASCNFGFAETMADAADPTFDPKGDDGVFGSDRSFVFGDADGDHNVDLLMVSGKGEVSLFPGKGDGHFKAAVTTTIDAGTDATPSALSLAGMGDFDGDGLEDFVARQTVYAATPVLKKIGHVVVGYGKADGTFQLVTLPFSIAATDKSGKRLAKWTSIADLDGDGKDDLVVAGTETEAVYFGEANRKLTLGKSPVPPSGTVPPVSDRVLTFATAKTGLVVNNGASSWKVTFAADRKATMVQSTLTAPDLSMRVATDLDGDNRPELTLFDPGNDRVSIVPLGENAPAATKFVKFPGTSVDYLDFGLDLANDQKHQLVYKTDARKLFAACGYSATTQEIVGVELPVAYGDKTVVIGTPDLNGDGKPDFTTFNFDTKAMKVFLGTSPPATVPPQISYYAEGFVPPVVDAGPPDSGPIEVDAGPQDDSGVIVVTDSGPGDDSGVVDAGTDSGPIIVDAGKDSGPKDAGKDSGPKPPKDSGTTNPPGDDDDDDTTSGDDDDDGPAKPKDAGSKPSPKPGTSSSGGATSSTSGSITVTTKATPQEDDGGCSTAPGGSSSSSGSMALGAIVALSLVRRRKKTV